ncbi:MAG: hypothetical protein WCP58_11920, partial [bacterium]
RKATRKGRGVGEGVWEEDGEIVGELIGGEAQPTRIRPTDNHKRRRNQGAVRRAGIPFIVVIYRDSTTFPRAFAG